MRIECPHCSAGYDLPPEKVPPGRPVRCVRCSQTWTPVPGPIAVVQPVAPAPVMPELPVAAATVAAPRKPVSPPSLLQRVRLPMAWVLTLVVLGAVGWAAVTRRVQIMQAWPPSERAYIALGLVPRS